jgi:hypothetical protein
MKKSTFLMVLSCSILFLHCAPAYRTTGQGNLSGEKCNAPVWNVGDSWKFQNSNKGQWSYEVTKVEKDIYIIDVSKGNEIYGFDVKTLELKAFSIDSRRRGLRPESEAGLFFDFPLYVGKKWGKMVSGQYADRSPTTYLHEFRVLSLENITVSAGIFKAFKIEFIRKHFSTFGFVKGYIWYSPEAKNIIKSVVAEPDTGTAIDRWQGDDMGYELVSLKLKD